jgi:hypothetical protein
MRSAECNAARGPTLAAPRCALLFQVGGDDARQLHWPVHTQVVILHDVLLLDARRHDDVDQGRLEVVVPAADR